MKFRICGELDAPDWILKEIEVLSKMSSVKFLGLCGEIVNKLMGGKFDYDRIEKRILAGSDISDTKAVIAAVTYIIRNSAKYNVKPETVSLELQQLGLPNTHAGAVERTITNEGEKLRAYFRKSTLRLNRLENCEWRVDFVLSSSNLQELNAPSVQLNFNIAPSDGGATQSHAFAVDNDKFRVFLSELKAARTLMEGL